MKKLILSFILALVMVLTLTGAVFADDPSVSVEASDIEVVGTGQVGTGVSVSGSVTVEIQMPDGPWIEFENIDGAAIAGYGIDGEIIDLTYQNMDGTGIDGLTLSFTYDWSDYFIITGSHSVTHGGAAWADFWYSFFGTWGEDFDFDCDIENVKIQGWIPIDWYDNGQLEIAITNLTTSHRGYPYEPGFSPVAASPIELPMTTMDVIQFGRDPTGARLLRVDLPSGTSVTDENGDPVYKILIIYHEYYGTEPYLEIINADKPGSQMGTEMNFSNPLEISKGNQYDPFTSLTQVTDGRVDL